MVMRNPENRGGKKRRTLIQLQVNDEGRIQDTDVNE